ncbi:SMP-30/gluconolactonase/LRE family protein [Gordonia sp. McavH-238-E]|uniref:SMP-30/gluconolactonase/LRE family protein n=1 Tax=Gordonia sp. McavH-238-E TaxID=2917736 RepID=UPI0023B7E13A|nr:SMP-30/gluconolactonase/LRE family protein [Gordonia sp. McavH-238-E]
MTYSDPSLVAPAIAAAGARVIEPRRVATGFSWPECPRWHDDTLWFSDMYTATLKTVDSSGNVRTAVDATGRRTPDGVPVVLGGFGWLPDGRLIVVSMHERLVLVHGGRDPDDLEVYADIAPFCPSAANDMVVDADGRAYVTQLGFDIFTENPQVASSPLVVVEPDGSSHAADAVGPLQCANGIGISSDGSQVYAAEVLRSRIIMMDRSSDGSLSAPEEFAGCPFLPDGIALDEEGGVWAALPGGGHVVRVTRDGMTDAVPIPLSVGSTAACVLGGPERSTLYVMVGVEVYDFEKSAREKLGSIWTAEVPYRGGATRP